MHENTLSSSFSGHNSLEKALFTVVDSLSPHGCPRRYPALSFPNCMSFLFDECACVYFQCVPRLVLADTGGKFGLSTRVLQFRHWYIVY